VNPREPAHGVGTVKVTLDYLPYNRSQVPVTLMESVLVLSKEGVEVGSEHPVEHRGFRMSLPVECRHTGSEVSQESGRIVQGAVSRQAARAYKERQVLSGVRLGETTVDTCHASATTAWHRQGGQ
jgi:hypothetical protein